MYAAVERAIRFSRKFSYVAVAIAIVGACSFGRNDVSIEPERATAAAASSDTRSNAPPGADIPSGLQGDVPVSSPQNPAENKESCPSGMVLVEGAWCPEVSQPCAEWKDDPAKYQFARCARYAESTCKAPREPMRFCIDKYESADSTGLPAANVSWTEAAAACQAVGKRLCKEREWVFACEGEEMRPYPYGLVRSPELCNFEISEGLSTNKGELADKRQPVTANPDCVSPFGVANMVGNIDEWVVLDKAHYSQVNGGRKMLSGLKGGWWGPLRNRCRPTTVDHDEFFHELQTGYRCCADAT